MVCLGYSLSTTFIATLTTICCISGVLAVVENLVVLLAVRNIRSLRSTARYFMASLAAAELLSGFAGNSFFASWLILNHSRQEILQLTIETAVWLFTTTSVTFSLSNVALDRYIAVTSPLQYHNRMTSPRCVLLILFSWISALLGGTVAYVVPEKHLQTVWMCGAIISVLIPFCIIAFCYFRIYQATRSTFPIRENITDAQQMAENKRQRKTASTFGIIAGMFFVLFMPSVVINCIFIVNPPVIVDLKCSYFSASRKVWICIAVISYFSAIFDPWVYAIRMPDFRTALKTLLHRILLCCKEENSELNLP